MKSDTLQLPGVNLYYEVRGSGPVLLMIPGGPVDGGVFTGLAELLADRYTVVTYDPRGISRSVVEGEQQDQDLDVHADDARRLIESFGGEPANVFGSSGGGTIGLALAARFPGHVRTMIAHEPPVVTLLPDADHHLAQMLTVVEAWEQGGWGAGMQRFGEVIGIPPQQQDGPPPTPEQQAAFGRMMGNFDFFLGRGVKPISGYVPDVEALKSCDIVVGIGATSEGQLAYRTGVVLAEKLGTEPVVFPGDHGGYASSPEESAELMHQSFASRAM